MDIRSDNYRLYGKTRIQLVIIHGGPGAPGNVAPVARELSNHRGVLEPFQTADNIHDQLLELNIMLIQKCDYPVIMIGHSWGAWLAYMYAAIYPDMIKKLIMIGAGPFEEHYASGILQARMDRMTNEDKKTAQNLMNKLQSSTGQVKKDAFVDFGKFMSRADAYDRIYEENEVVEHQPDIFYKVWAEAAQLRQSGKLLQFGKQITCPVVAIHGDYDPHPADGVNLPLSGMIKDFTFVLLGKCGHDPWNERQTRDEFFKILKQQIGMVINL